VQVGAADRARRERNNGIGWFSDFRVIYFFETNVSDSMEYNGFHERPLTPVEWLLDAGQI
jgi:hypothetical protein